MSKYKARLTGARQNQSGMASIFIVMILMAILALISLGFSQLMNREVRQSLDRQLSAEAYYAAESGVNDAKAYLADSTNQPSITGCQNFSTGPGSQFFVSGGDISGDGVSKYPCLGVNVRPNELFFNLTAGESKTFRVGSADVASLYFSWEKDKSGVALGNIPNLPKEDTIGNSNGLLRVALYPIATNITGSSDTNATLAGDSRNYFMYPQAGNGASPGTVDYTSGNGQFVNGNCNVKPTFQLPDNSTASRFCNSKITGLDPNGGVSGYFIKVTAMYTPLVGAIQVADKNGNNEPVAHDQGIIDVTGAGSDVSRRVRAIVSTQPEFDNPGNALWSMQAICKLFRAPVTQLGQYDPASTDDSSGSGDSLCTAATPSGSGPINGNPSGCIPTPGCPPVCGGADTCGGCIPTPGCPPVCGGADTCPPPRTAIRTAFGCWLDNIFTEGEAAGVCRADNGTPGNACYWTAPPSPTFGACP